MKRPLMVWIGLYQFVAQKLPRKAKVALVCWYYKELLKTLKVSQKLPSTIYLCLVTVPGDESPLLHEVFATPYFRENPGGRTS